MPKRILIQGHPRGIYHEGIAAAALSPGHLLEFSTTAKKVQKHSVYGGLSMKAFALEDALQGKNVDTAFASDDVVPYYVPAPFEEINALLAHGTSYARNDFLISGGDGTLVKAATRGAQLLYSSVAASAEHENTTDEALFDKQYTLPANFVQAGDVLHVRAQIFVVDNNSTDTLTVKLYLGGLTGTAVCTTGAVDVADGDVGYIDAYICFRTIGATGTLVATGLQGLGVPGTVTAKPFLLGSTAVDTTAAKVIGVGADWSVAHEDNEVRLDFLTVELLRDTQQFPVAILETAADRSAATAATLTPVRILG
jgi:hypothetical protein